MKVTELAKAQLAEATNLEPLVVSGADRDEGGWRLKVEMVELPADPRGARRDRCVRGPAG